MVIPTNGEINMFDSIKVTEKNGRTYSVLDINDEFGAVKYTVKFNQPSGTKSRVQSTLPREMVMPATINPMSML